jgi:thiol-disulfide isomerase/thioredoxin
LPELFLTDGRGGAAPPPAGEALYGFFKTACPTCELAWPFFERIGRLARGGRLAVVAVSQDEPRETTAFNERLGVRLPTLFDSEPWRASEALGLENVPTFLRVGADGKLRDALVGFQKQKMQDFAAEAASLAGRPATQLFRPGENVPAIKPG